MRMFAKIDGAIDRFDRAALLTPPFDMVITGIVPPLFRLYDQATDAIIATIAGAARSLDLTGLLDDGFHTLGLTRVDIYGNESTRATITVVSADGVATAELIRPTQVLAVPVAGAEVSLSWVRQPAEGQVEPTEYEVADAEDLDTILATIPITTERRYSAIVGPFPEEAITLAVRSSDGATQRSQWVEANEVEPDETPPPVPRVLPAG